MQLQFTWNPPDRPQEKIPRRYVSKWVPHNSNAVTVLLIGASMITSITLGYDGSMMNALNILPSYTDYFSLDTATLALNTASVWVGGCISGFFAGQLTDWVGRRPALFYAAIITVVGVILQSAAQNIAMFIAGRIIIGIGTGVSSVAAPTYLSETTPIEWRAFSLGIFYDFWYVGGLISAGVTFGTA